MVWISPSFLVWLVLTAIPVPRRRFVKTGGVHPIDYHKAFFAKTKLLKLVDKLDLRKVALACLLWFLVSGLQLLSLLSVHAAEVKLFVSFAGEDSVLEQSVLSSGFIKLPIVYGKNMDPDHDGSLNVNVYSIHVEEKLKNYSGPVVLNWEGKAYQNLTDRESTINKSQIVSEYVNGINIARRSTEGDIMVGFYGFPSSRSTNTRNTMKEFDELREIYNSSQALFPSLYLTNNTDSPELAIFNEKKHLLNALKVACSMLDRPKVYGFVTHRWHPNSKRDPNALIPLDLFREYLGMIKTVKFESCAIDGIVWWGADEHWYHRGKEKNRRSLAKSIDSYGGMSQYMVEVIDRYSAVIIQTFH